MVNFFEKEKDEVEIKKEDLMRRIQKMKCESESKPDEINIHLKGIDAKVLATSLEEDDYQAFKKAFNNEWLYDTKDFKEYEENIVAWEKREKMDSGESPKLKVRRNFAAMIRTYVVDRSIKKKIEEKMKKADNNLLTKQL